MIKFSMASENKLLQMLEKTQDNTQKGSTANGSFIASRFAQKWQTKKNKFSIIFNLPIDEWTTT